MALLKKEVSAAEASLFFSPHAHTMEAKFPKASTLKKIVDAIKDLVTEANIDCSPAGINFLSMDSSHVALVTLLIRPDSLDKFTCHRPVTLGVNFTTLSKVIRVGGGNDDSLTLYSAPGSDVLRLTFENADGTRVSNFDIKLMDIQGEQLGLPDEMNFTGIFSMPSSEFSRTCRDLTILGDTVAIDVCKTHVEFLLQGDNGNASVKLKEGENVKESVSITSKQPSTKASFSLKYLMYFNKAAPLAETVKISIAEELPLMVEYLLDNGDTGYVRYYLASKNEAAAGENP